MTPPTVGSLNENKWSSYWYRRRRHTEWTDNYTLYRDKVQLNRLTQRQSVNIPLIKYSIKTLLKDIDDPPMLYFVNIDNDEQAEVFYNEYWNASAENTKTTIKDIVDKRQVLLFGRSFKHLNLFNGEFYWEVKDPQDIGIDRYVDPADIDSARFIIIEHNYVPLASIGMNPRWNKEAVLKLQEFYSTKDGLRHAGDNMLDYTEKQARLLSMGVVDQMNPILGETYIELVEHFTKVYNDELGEDQIIYSVVADDAYLLYQEPLEDVIGETVDNYWRNHFPLTTWGDETERTDFWSDGVADTLRTLNKIMNAWFSQMIENRTLRNFGMSYYNASLSEDGFTPQSFNPEPFGWYPIPAGEHKIGDQIMRVDIPELATDGVLEEMNFIKQIAEQASAATTFQQGQQEGGQAITLGEVKLLLANAQERVKSMAVYYTDSWKEFGHKYIKLLEASPHLLNDKLIHKKGRLTKKVYSRVISPKDWYSKSGFKVEVKMKSEKIEEDMNSLQWLNAGRSIMPNNPIVDEEYKQKILENGGLSSEKIMEALKFDKQQAKEMAQAMMGKMPQTKAPTEVMNYKDVNNASGQSGDAMLQQANLPPANQQQQPQPGNGQPNTQPQTMQQPQQKQLPSPSQIMQMQ